MNNPLNKFFRQPKIFITLPTRGKYCIPGVVEAVEELEVYGMTGADEIILKTPDALFNGFSITKIIESCIPKIKNAFELSATDIEMLLIAIRIASNGNTLTLTNICECGTEEDYQIKLDSMIDYFVNCKFIEEVTIPNNLVVKLKPITYKDATNFSIEGYKFQKQMSHILNLTDELQQQKLMSELYNSIDEQQKSMLLKSISAIYIVSENTVVTDSNYINEWLSNVEAETTDLINEVIKENKKTWDMPPQKAICSNPECKKEHMLSVKLDNSFFFG